MAYHTTHKHTLGYKQTKIYRAWAHMKDRCYNPKCQFYYRYGGRGIKVCEAWLNFEGFLADMGASYKDGLTIDRINNDGHYVKENCRWVNIEEQANNRSSTHSITYQGKTQSIARWSKELNINYFTLYNRLMTKRWSIDRAFQTPINQPGCNKIHWKKPPKISFCQGCGKELHSFMVKKYCSTDCRYKVWAAINLPIRKAKRLQQKLP